MNEITAERPDLQALKARQQATWASGDYSVVGTTLQIVGEQLCETIALRPGAQVLDVAAGNGNATLAAARRFCDVTSTDYVPALLERGRERAAAERQAVRFQVQDAENLRFPDDSFDVVLSTFGVMFVADHARAAGEMLRVCRPGGIVAMANWTPEGFIGQLFRVIGRHVPPPPGARSPTLWGTETALREMFGTAADTIALHAQSFTFRYRTPDHFIDTFRRWYGPTHKAFAAAADPAALEADIRTLIDGANVALDGTMAVPSAYVEVVIRPK